VPGAAITVLHRPILGIESVANPQGTLLSGKPETDEALRVRARRALETAGRATVGALTGELASLAGIREKDILLTEDSIQRPGVVVLTVAAELDPSTAARAIDIIEDARPVGVRVIHRLDATQGPSAIVPGENVVPDEESDTPADDTLGGEQMWAPVVVNAILVPTAAALTAEDRAQLKGAGDAAIRAAVDLSGVGEPVIFNRVVAALMAVPGVQDVAMEMYLQSRESGPRHRNLYPPSTLRPTVSEDHGGEVNVLIGGQVVALNVTADIHLFQQGGDAAADLEAARVTVLSQLREGIASITSITPANLLALLHLPPSFGVPALSYRAEYLTAGVQLTTLNPPLTLTAEEVAWIRKVSAHPV
jgi:hypothetical protein